MITVTITRSDSWVAEQRILTGTNVPESVKVKVDPANLSEQTRRTLIQAYKTFRDIGPIYYDCDFSPAPSWSHGSEYVCIDSDSPTIEEIDAAISDAFARIRGKKSKAEKEEAAREAAQRATAAAWAALPLMSRASEDGVIFKCASDRAAIEKYAPVAYAEAADQAALLRKAKTGEQAAEDRETLARFLAFIPGDALRGALKSMARSGEPKEIEALRQKIEDASPVVIFEDEDN